MRILNREQFLSLPKGVVYTKLDELDEQKLYIKEESLSNDWEYQELYEIDTEHAGQEDEFIQNNLDYGSDIPLHFHTTARDALYENRQLFAVLDKSEVLGLIGRLQQTIDTYPPIDHLKAPIKK